jgi:8-oxo-dGTP diphosphatase
MRQAVRAIIIRDNQLLVMHRNKFGQEYYSLVGGGVDLGETPEQALVREVKEETSLVISRYRLVFIEEAGHPFGTQLIFVADYPGGEAVLPEESPEAAINKLGKNLYKVEWLPLGQLKDSQFLSETLKNAILHALEQGWPTEPIKIHHSLYQGVKNGS